MRSKVAGICLFCFKQVEKDKADMGVSKNQGLSYRPQCTMTLTVIIPKKRSLIQTPVYPCYKDSPKRALIQTPIYYDPYYKDSRKGPRILWSRFLTLEQVPPPCSWRTSSASAHGTRLLRGPRLVSSRLNKYTLTATKTMAPQFQFQVVNLKV